MHIPDGMLDTKTWATAWVGSAGVLGYALARIRKTLSDSRIVLMAVLAALIFALQMLNFPVAIGTSGHFAGGAAAAIILGPLPAVVIMAVVLLIQALLFADGGITTLGANMVNMAIIGPFVGWWVYRAMQKLKGGDWTRPAGAFVGAWAGCFIAALGAAFMLWTSGNAPLGVALGSMGGWHALIGVGEGVITAGLVAYLFAVRPDLMRDGVGAQGDVKRVATVLGGLAVLAAGLSFLASGSPDGLEHAYEHVGAPFEGFSLVSSPIPDYVVPGVANETLAGILAGVVGLIVTGVLLYALISGLRARRAAD